MDTIKPTAITFDPAKDAANIRARGLPFSLVKDGFDWSSALIGEDTRRDYGERLDVVVFAWADDAVRVISFRKANQREMRRYGKATQPGTD